MNIKLLLGSILMFIVSCSISNAQCPTMSDCTPTGWLMDNQTRTLCASPAGGTFVLVAGNGSVSGNVFTPMQRRLTYMSTVNYDIVVNGTVCTISIGIPIMTTAPDCPNVGISGPSSTSTSVGQSVSTSVSVAGATRTPSWSISPATGVSQASGTGTGTGNITFNNAGVYTVTFSVSNDNDVCNLQTVNNFTYTRQITVSAYCTVPVRN